MARPRKNISDKLTEKINVVTTSARKARAEAAAKELDVSLSSLMNLALDCYLDPERQGINRRSYRRFEVVDCLGRAAVALEDIVLISRAIGLQERLLEVSAGLLRVERLLAAVALGAGLAGEDTPSVEGDPE